MTIRTCTLKLLVFLLCSAFLCPFALAQAPNPELIVNGNFFPPSALLGSTGNDYAVMATPFLQATGANVRVTNGILEAAWIDKTLKLKVGSPICQVNGRDSALSTPCGTLDNDVVVPLNEICTILGIQVQKKGDSLIIWKHNEVDDGRLTASKSISVAKQSPTQGENSAYPPGFALLSVNDHNVSGAIPGTGGMAGATPESITGRAFPEAGMGGLSSKAEGSSPYDRPIVSTASIGSSSYTVETPRSIDQVVAGVPPYPQGPRGGATGVTLDKFGMPTTQEAVQAKSVIVYSAAPAPVNSSPKVLYRSPSDPQPIPAKGVVSDFNVQRIMSFFLTTYELKAKIKNEGELAFDKPFRVQFLAKSARYDRYDLLESFLINPLNPGESVEITKKADGHQFPCLMDLTITFKAVVLEDAPPKMDVSTDITAKRKRQRAGEKKYGTGVVEGSSREKTLRY